MGSTEPGWPTNFNHRLSSTLSTLYFSNYNNNNFSNVRNNERNLFIISTVTSQPNTTIYTTPSEPISLFDSDPSNILLVILYCIVTLAGMLGNALLVITLCTQSTNIRLRNPLMMALCLADLMVTGISAPLTIILLALTHNKSWTLSTFSCKIVYFLQSMPVAASTLSLLMLSLDRYATVKHPRLAQIRQRRLLPSILAIVAWSSAILLCVPILIAYTVIQTKLSPSSVANSTIGTIVATTSYLTITTGYSTINSLNKPTMDVNSTIPSTVRLKNECIPYFASQQLHHSYYVIHALLVFVIPGVGVVLNHLGVRDKLCALSLTARAAHGELPLPMPILRRPTHMIIVTGMAQAAAAAAQDDSDDEDVDEVEKSFIDQSKIKFHPRTPRSLRHSQQYQKSSRNTIRLSKTTKSSKTIGTSTTAGRHQAEKFPTSELPLPQTSTLRSRRRLANMLVAAAIIFVLCWSPHVICSLCHELAAINICTKTVSQFSLLLGYAHSAISPLLYWALNQTTLRQSASCAPFMRLSSVQKFLRTHLRVAAPPPPPSSTNEAALGPFNPRYIKPRPQQYHAAVSSHYLY